LRNTPVEGDTELRTSQSGITKSRWVSQWGGPMCLCKFAPGSATASDTAQVFNGCAAGPSASQQL